MPSKAKTKSNKLEVASAGSGGWMGSTELQEFFSISHMTVERRLKPEDEGGDPEFPRPTLMGRLRKFARNDVKRYEKILVRRGLEKAR
jgi:hypothetical protein